MNGRVELTRPAEAAVLTALTGPLGDALTYSLQDLLWRYLIEKERGDHDAAFCTLINQIGPLITLLDAVKQLAGEPPVQRAEGADACRSRALREIAGIRARLALDQAETSL